jgi:hypothetical protein
MTTTLAAADAPSTELTADGVPYAIRQSRGVGSALAHRLFDYARRQGLLRMCASISATNSRMLSLAHWLGFTTGMTPGESSLLSAQLVLAPAPLLTSTG